MRRFVAFDLYEVERKVKMRPLLHARERKSSVCLCVCAAAAADAFLCDQISLF